MLGNIETLLTNTSRPISSELLPLDILSKLKPVTPLAGTLVKLLPSPVKDPVKEPEKDASSSLDSSSLNSLSFPLETFSNFLLLPVPSCISEVTIFFKTLF